MPAVDLVSLIKKLPPESALAREESGPWGRWDAHKENTARLMEVMSYQLELNWVDRITDPDDPELKRERAKAKRAGLKPPAHPLIPPIAMRPSEIAQERFTEYRELVDAHNAPQITTQASSRSSFDLAWGFDS